MKKLLLALALVAFAITIRAESWTDQYSQYGKLFVVKLDTAPFPHPKRAQGHKYGTNFYSTEKNYSDNSVGIFVPKGFRRTDKVDFVVHFHGWRHHVENTFSIYHLVPQFVDSQRNAILVVPQGPYDAPDSFDGKMDDENGFKRFMTDVRAAVEKEGIIGTEPIGDIILSGHSGGYGAMSGIVARGGMNDNIKEIFIFDALYAGTEDFMSWFDHNPNRRMINLYTAHGGTKEETEKLIAAVKERKPPVSYIAENEDKITTADLKKYQLIFIFTPLEHDLTPYEHKSFQQFLETSRLPSIEVAESPKAEHP
jgi:hypothetical protein